MEKEGWREKIKKAKRSRNGKKQKITQIIRSNKTKVNQKIRPKAGKVTGKVTEKVTTKNRYKSRQVKWIKINSQRHWYFKITYPKTYNNIGNPSNKKSTITHKRDWCQKYLIVLYASTYKLRRLNFIGIYSWNNKRLERFEYWISCWYLGYSW